MTFRLTRGGRPAIPGFLVLFAALHAACARPTVPVPFQPVFDSKEAAATAVLRALEARDDAALARTALTESEFLKFVWPALPASQPEVGMPADRAWAEHDMRDRNFRLQTLAAWGGRRYDLVTVVFRGESTTYDGFTVHRETALTVRERGADLQLTIFGSMIESGGRWKVYSFVVD